jgi:DNA-binding transcriptional ArsR family regulator
MTARRHLDQTFAALGDPTRLAVVSLLRKSPRRSSELADALSTTRPTMSRHLGVLRKAGLIEESSVEDDARARMYRLRPERIADVRTWVEEVEAYWAEQLGGFKAHIEKKYGRGRQ